MPKNIKEIMIALNKVLTTTVWVNGDRIFKRRIAHW